MLDNQSPDSSRRATDTNSYPDYTSMKTDDVIAELEAIKKLIKDNHEPCHERLQKLLSNPNTLEIIKNNGEISKRFRDLYEDSTRTMAASLATLNIELISNITSNDFYKKVMNEKVLVPTLSKQTAFFNNVSKFIRNDMLQRNSIDERTLAMEYWYEVAADCLLQGNVNMAFAINSAFGSGDLGRLHATREGLSQRGKSVVSRLAKLASTDANSSAYREYMEAHPGAIPYFGRYSTDILFIKNGAPINWLESAVTYKIIADIKHRLKQIKNKKLDFQVSEQLRAAIFAFDSAGNIDKEYFDISLRLEPRGEKIKASELLSTFYPHPEKKQDALLDPTTEESGAVHSQQHEEKQVSFFIYPKQESWLLLIQKLFNTEKIVVMKDEKSDDMHLADGYLLDHYARNLFINNKNEFSHVEYIVDEPPIRKMMATIYLMMSDPKFFYEKPKSKAEKPKIANRVAMMKQLTEELSDQEFNTVYALINSRDLSQLRKGTSAKKIPTKFLAFMKEEHSRRAEMAAKAASVVETPDRQRSPTLKIKRDNKNQPEQEATSAVPAAPAIPAATAKPVPPIVATTPTAKLLETIKTFVDETKITLSDLNTSYQQLLATIHTNPPDIDANKASYLLLQKEIEQIQKAIALKICDIKDEKARINKLTSQRKLINYHYCLPMNRL